MSRSTETVVNRFLAGQIFSCPLKLHYLRSEEAVGEEEGAGYRSAERHQLRRVLKLKYPGGLEAGQDEREAERQTAAWLSAPDGILYGGLVRSGRFRARIPLLIARGERLILIQAHRRLWKAGERTVRSLKGAGKSLETYLRTAAYRRWLLSRLLPDCPVDIRLCFPDPDFQAESDHLFEKVASGEAAAEEAGRVLLEVNATGAVDSVIRGESSDHLHPCFRGCTFEAQMTLLEKMVAGREEIPFQVTGSCKRCRFRYPDQNSGAPGCWESRLEGEFTNPDRHIFDLFGRDGRVENGRLLQEQVKLPSGLETYDRIAASGRKRITMEERRALQLLDMRGGRLPLEWMREELTTAVSDVRFPLHFIDFEAASTAVPLNRSDSPYSPVLFQFSCHSMSADGNVVHTEWLDETHRGVSEMAFARQFIRIPDVAEGTFVHYSPFERQILNRLRRKLPKREDSDAGLARELGRLIREDRPGRSSRFLDLSKLAHDFYYNRYLTGGLGLKELLPAVLRCSPGLQAYLQSSPDESGLPGDLFDGSDTAFIDPYLLIRRGDEAIDDGPTAMYAWLFARSTSCSEEKRKRIRQGLRRYCALDSFAMVLIFRHWLDRIGNLSGEREVIVWESGSY